jgi:hypothetical protein
MAGSIAITSSDIGGGIIKYSIAWTSDASGNVNGSTIDLRRGRLRQVKYAPGTGGAQPTTGYNATLVDVDGVDLLSGGGATLSNAAATMVAPASPLFIESQTVTPTITGAGNAKGGTLNLYIGP